MRTLFKRFATSGLAVLAIVAIATIAQTQTSSANSPATIPLAPTSSVVERGCPGSRGF